MPCAGDGPYDDASDALTDARHYMASDHGRETLAARDERLAELDRLGTTYRECVEQD